jgi:hypothetical protein
MLNVGTWLRSYSYFPVPKLARASICNCDSFLLSYFPAVSCSDKQDSLQHVKHEAFLVMEFRSRTRIFTRKINLSAVWQSFCRLDCYILAARSDARATFENVNQPILFPGRQELAVPHRSVANIIVEEEYGARLRASIDEHAGMQSTAPAVHSCLPLKIRPHCSSFSTRVCIPTTETRTCKIVIFLRPLCIDKQADQQKMHVALELALFSTVVRRWRPQSINSFPTTLLHAGPVQHV